MDVDQSKAADMDAGEYTLTQLIEKLWQVRVAIIAGAAAAMTLAAMFVALTHFDKLRRDTLVGHIELTAITNGSYPSGASFSPSDLISGEVLTHLRERLDLPPELPLAETLTVEYGHPALSTLRQERNAALARAQDSEMPIEDMQSLRGSYQERINSLSRGGLQIRLNLDQLNISEETGRLMIEALPDSWQRIYGQRYRILLPPAVTRLSRISVSDDFNSADAPLAADRYLRQARQTLNAIGNDSRISSVTAPNGASASELIYQLDQFRQIFFDPCLASQVADETNALGQLFIRDLRAERRQLGALLDETTRTIETVSRMRGNGTVAPENATGSGRVEGQPVLSLSDDGIRSIIDLAEQSSMQDYLTRLFDRRYNLTQQIAAIETRIEKFTDSESLSDLAQAGMADAIGVRFQAFETEVSALVDAAHQRVTRSTASLYEFIGEPSAPSLLPEPRRAGMIIGLSAALGGLFGLLAGLIRRAIKQPAGA